MMKFKCNTARELLVSIVLVGLLSFWLLPAITPPIRIARKKSCANNLRQLYRLGLTYASTHQGLWPDATGTSLWRSFTKTSPPLIGPDDLDVLICPFRTDDPSEGRCDYMGPRKPVSSLKPQEALGACTHEHQDEDSRGSVIFKDGSVREVDYSDPLWETLAP
jgi:type II secretory pathway pseudopilin PulG